MRRGVALLVTLVLGSAHAADEPTSPFPYCLDQAPPPVPKSGQHAHSSAVRAAVADDIFPQMLVPVHPDKLRHPRRAPFYDDQGVTYSGKQVFIILYAFPATQDNMTGAEAAKDNMRAAREAAREAAGGGYTAGGGYIQAAPDYKALKAADKDIDELRGLGESIYGQAICTYNAAMAVRRARALGEDRSRPPSSDPNAASPSVSK